VTVENDNIVDRHRDAMIEDTIERIRMLDEEQHDFLQTALYSKLNHCKRVAWRAEKLSKSCVQPFAQHKRETAIRNAANAGALELVAKLLREVGRV
jgi:hypothetical protein